MPGPRSTTRTTIRGPTRRERTRTGWPRPWTTAFSSRLAKARSSWVGSALIAGSSESSASRTSSPRAPIESPRRLQQPRQVDRLAARLGVPGLQAGDVEQVLDQAREALALLDHGVAELVALLRGDAGRVEGGAGGDDRGQRRAQVVGDRAQQRGLELVAAAQRLGLDRLGLHAVALLGQRRQLLQRPVGLLAAPLGLGGAGAGELGQGAAGHGDDREDEQGDEVVVGGDVETAQRRQVEPVEGGGAEQRRQQPQPQPPDGRDQQHAGDVDDAERDRRGDFLQRVDEQRRRGDDGEGRKQPEPTGGRLATKSEGASLVSLRRDAQRLGHSYCKDSRTSSLEARRAGRIAARTPARAARTSSTTSEPIG